MNIIAYTQGETVPSARFRLSQYVSTEAFKALNINVEVSPTRGSSYPPVARLQRVPWFAATLAERAHAALKSKHFDLAFLQRQMLSTLYTAERLIQIPLIFDVDDAIWLSQRRQSVFKIADKAAVIVAGNSFIAEALQPYNNNIRILPTAVDMRRFDLTHSQREPIIVWSGSSSGYKYLEFIAKPLGQFFKNHSTWTLKIISDEPPPSTLSDIPTTYIEWNPSVEVEAMRNASAGIMPVADTDWERGKCSYKMLTYMSCRLPVIVSSVGMNIEVLNSLGGMGIGCMTGKDWTDALNYIAEVQMYNPQTLDAMGEASRSVIRAEYSTELLAASLAHIILETHRGVV